MEKKPSCLRYIGDYTTQLYVDCNEALIIRIPIKQHFFRGSIANVFWLLNLVDDLANLWNSQGKYL